MRWRLVVGCGFAGAIAGSALAQFAVDRAPPSPSPAPAPGLPAANPLPPSQPLLPPGLQPVAPASPGAYAPPVGGVAPAGGVYPTAGAYPSYPTLASATGPAPQRALAPPPKIEIESALGPNHPWALKPETGAYFICVKSYSRPHTPTPEDSGPSARALAEALASEIRQGTRDRPGVQAFLFEYISPERRAEAAALAAERERGRIFAGQIDSLKKQSTLQGMDFMDPDNKIRFKTVSYRDQIAVLIGPFQTMEAGRLALEEVHKWPAPSQKILMDAAVAGHYATKDGKRAWVQDGNGYMNPYQTATVAPNPMAPHPVQADRPRLDPVLIKWNEDNPYNLLKATKNWTIAVKSFNAPVELVGKDAKVTEPTWVQKLFANPNKNGANALLAASVQAEKMAQMLRDMKGPGGQPLNLEAFVLHTRHASLVTVGQFDSLDDPALIQTQNLLSSMRLHVSEDKMGSKPVANAPRLFEDRLQPMPIPKP